MENFLIVFSIVLAICFSVYAHRQKKFADILERSLDEEKEIRRRIAGTNAELKRSEAAVQEEFTRYKADIYLKVSNLSASVEAAEEHITSLQKEKEDLEDVVETKQARIEELEKKLAASKKNDTPKDPKTGKFTSKKKVSTKS